MTKGHQPKDLGPKTPPEGRPQIETEQTRAAKALAEQVALSNESVEFDADEHKTTEVRPVEYTLKPGESVAIVEDDKVVAVVASPGAGPADPELRLAPLYAALATAQGAFPEIPKNRTATIRPQTGEPWSYKYSDLSDLIKAVRKPLAENGLGFYQHPTEDGKSLATVVFHQTGLAVTTLYPMHQTTGGRMHPAQNYSVGGTYAKRNGLSAALGVASEETVEGNQSNKTNPDFEAASGDGVLTVRGVVIPEGATKADTARLFGEAIETQMQAASTLKGLDGVWNRNEEVINGLQDRWPDIYNNIVEAYEQTKAAIGEE